MLSSQIELCSLPEALFTLGCAGIVSEPAQFCLQSQNLQSQNAGAVRFCRNCVIYCRAKCIMWSLWGAWPFVKSFRNVLSRRQQPSLHSFPWLAFHLHLRVSSLVLDQCFPEWLTLLLGISLAYLHGCWLAPLQAAELLLIVCPPAWLVTQSMWLDTHPPTSGSAHHRWAWLDHCSAVP